MFLLSITRSLSRLRNRRTPNKLDGILSKLLRGSLNLVYAIDVIDTNAIANIPVVGCAPFVGYTPFANAGLGVCLPLTSLAEAQALWAEFTDRRGQR